MENKHIARHGDVDIIRKVDALPADAKLLLGRKELAYGEVTGHAHRLDVGEIFETRNGEFYFKVDKEVKLTHEEHKPVNSTVLTPGIYQFAPKRQYTPTVWEKVRD